MAQALIVDDSKTARVSLRKMLEKQDVSCAMVDSAEEALEYLKGNHPSMIFMDHMMPGMDGFDAVKVIKADPETASIAIIMYTTKQGDIYVGQARALGAADILPKPATVQALIQVLERIKTIAPKDKIISAPVLPLVEPSGIEGASASVPASISSSALAHSQLNTPSVIEPNRPRVFTGLLRPSIVLVLWLLPIVYLLLLYIPLAEQGEQFAIERDALYQSLEWAINNSEGYDYGEPALSGRRLELLEGLISHLKEAKFVGTVRIEGHIGEFCVTKIELEAGGFVNMLPAAQLSLSECTSIGMSADRAAEQSVQQSEAFMRYLVSSALVNNRDITVEIVKRGATEAKYDYPEIIEETTVGDWNAIALRNNRVKFVLLPKH